MPTELERFEKAIVANLDKFHTIKREIFCSEILWTLGPYLHYTKNKLTNEYRFETLLGHATLEEVRIYKGTEQRIAIHHKRRVQVFFGNSQEELDKIVAKLMNEEGEE